MSDRRWLTASASQWLFGAAAGRPMGLNISQSRNKAHTLHESGSAHSWRSTAGAPAHICGSVAGTCNSVPVSPPQSAPSEDASSTNQSRKCLAPEIAGATETTVAAVRSPATSRLMQADVLFPRTLCQPARDDHLRHFAHALCPSATT